MTDADRQAANERIATAMGWKAFSVGHSIHPDGGVRKSPDFFTDPVAADSLMRWLKKEKCIVQMHQSFEYGARILVRPQGPWKEFAPTEQSPDWKTALALAADAAIQESNHDQRHPRGDEAAIEVHADGPAPFGHIARSFEA